MDARRNNEFDKIIQLRKQLQSILNQLTHDNFNARLNELKSFLRIQSPYVITEIVDVLMEKAISEPNSSAIYAMMCRELDFFCTVIERANVAKKSTFKMKLTSLCQIEHERYSTEYLKAVNAIQEDMLLHDPKSEDRKAKLMEKQSRIRQRANGIVRFIGELYKIGWIPVNIVQQCDLKRFSCS